MTRLRAALRVAGGAPRLYRSARGAGAGPAQAAGVLAVSALVLFVVAPRAAGVPGRQNAVRHFVWQAALTSRYGVDVARAVAAAQEQGSVEPLDSAADLRNNAAGQAYGAAHAEELAGTPLRRAFDDLLAAGLELWSAGELATARSAAARAARRRHRGSRGRATPRTPS